MALEMRMLLTILTILVSMKLLWCDPVTRSSKVTVTGFDNHSNRSIARLVQIPVSSVLNSWDRRTALKTHIDSNQGTYYSR